MGEKRESEGRPTGRVGRAKVKLAGRSRPRVAWAIALTISGGLASRQFPKVLPDIFGKYPGDVLWAMMAFWLVAFVGRRLSTGTVARWALAIAAAVEFSQLYRAEWIRMIRATTPGHLVLGSTFSVKDLAAYSVGILLCVLVEKGWPRLLRQTRKDPPADA